MKIAIFHNAVSETSALDEKDTLEQVASVEAALRRLGHDPVRVPCTLDLAAVVNAVRRIAPDLGFNLVESLEARGHLIHLVPTLLDTLGLRYAGASSDALVLTSHKLLAKAWMAEAGIPVAPTLAAWPDPPPGWSPGVSPVAPPEGPFLIKSIWEHASVGLTGDVLLQPSDWPRIEALMAERAPRLGGSCFVEPYVEGREFNLSVLAGPDGPEVLPPAEILFRDYPAGKPRLVSYEAKWVEDSFECNHTERSFSFPASDAALLARLEAIALAAWRRFGLRGWARVDYRVAPDGSPLVLEVNANPCISPDAGFAAAVDHARIGYDEAVRRILSDVGPAVDPGAAPKK
jgi:D-alanine-D-alanine ligase